MMQPVTISNSFHGKTATNYFHVNGMDYQLITMKRADGLISCLATSGKLEKKKDYNTFLSNKDSEKLFLATAEKGTRATALKILMIQEDGMRRFIEKYVKKELKAFQTEEQNA